MTDLMPPKNYARIPVGLELPQLIQIQRDSFQRLKDEGLGSLFNEISNHILRQRFALVFPQQ